MFKSIQLLSALIVASVCLFSTANAADEAPDKYQSSCFACHGTGAAGAPKTGDKDAWAPRVAQGTAAMVTSVRKGKGAMPPGGLCADCTDDELKVLIEFMSDHSFEAKK